MVFFAKNNKSTSQQVTLRNFPACQENTKFVDISAGTEQH